MGAASGCWPPTQLSVAEGLAQETIEETLSVGQQFFSKAEHIFTYLHDNGGYILWNLVVVALILLAARGVLSLVSAFTRHVMHKAKYHVSDRQGRRVDTIMTLTRSVARYLIYFIAILMVLNQFGLGKPMNNLLVTAGIGSLAIGFGAKNLVQDVVTGFFMMFENQFSVGDFIKTDEAEGTVEATAMRVTYLRSMKGDQIIIPNGTITRVVNFSRGGYVASITVSTAYEADTRQVIGVIDRAVQGYADAHEALVVERPVVLGITSLGESSVDIGVVCKVQPMKQWEVERGMRLAVKEAFDALGVEFPYPRLVTVPAAPPQEHQAPLGQEAPKPPAPEAELPDWANAPEQDD